MASPGLGAGTSVTLADTGSTSSRLTAELSAQALAAQGFTVIRTTLPSASTADGALAAGTIDAYATETATLLEYVLNKPKVRDDAALTTMQPDRPPVEHDSGQPGGAADTAVQPRPLHRC